MPRLAPSLLARARALNPHLATLLPACRDLASARHELRWIREHVAAAVARGRQQQQQQQQQQQRRRRRRGVGGDHDDHDDVQQQQQQQHYDHARRARLLHPQAEAATVARLCARRGRGEPLQYVLGTQPFGPLEVRCRRGVLIPRPETEAWTARLAAELRGLLLLPRTSATTTTLDVLDVCTGTGCVALLLETLLRPSPVRLAVAGLDVAPRAVALARENARRHGAAHRVRFARADIFTDDWRRFVRGRAGNAGGGGGGGGGDAIENPLRVLVANPPYISTAGFGRDTGRSVRNFEPLLALVPTPAAVVAGMDMGGGGAGAPEDVFYRRLWDVAAEFGADVVALEVGDMAQARRVAALALRRPARPEDRSVRRLEIWRDWPDMAAEADEETKVVVGGRRVEVKGSGHGRVVVCHFDHGQWAE